MVDRKPLSKAEMEIARILWGLGEATVRQVHDALPSTRDLDYTTVQTYLARLESKGYLKYNIVDRSKVYSARIRPGRVIGEAIDDFVSALFGGESLPLIRHLLSQQDITAAELEELRRLIDTAREADDDA
ncbi:MAG: BlaI/MecI/CopY family transcriptional regulator [Planctomycetota bacterium]